jgi:MFS family permease
MTLILSLLAFLVAGAAATRSTWSPCGLSMLSTITPLEERSKGHRYAATSAWFVLGATVGGLMLGGVIALFAVATRSAGLSAAVAGTVGLVATLTVLASETGLSGVRLPVHRRQVNERWLDAYRPWVYGAGFGFQIGTGVATYITTAAVYLMVVLGALTGRPGVALAVGGVFGLVRGLAVTLTRRVTSPTGLLAFHQRFTTLRPWADRGVLASLSVVTVALATAVGVVPALVAAIPVAVGCIGVRVGVWVAHRTRSDDSSGRRPDPAPVRGESVPVG